MRSLTAKPAEILQVTDQIYRITLSQPFYAPNQVYLIRDETTMLIDSGYVESIGSLALALKQLGLSMREVDVILYTHPHIDHITAGLLWGTYARRTQKWGHHTMARDIPDYPDFIDVWQADTSRILTLAFRDKQARQTRIRKANDRWARFVRRFAEAQDVPGVGRDTDVSSATQKVTKQGDRAVKLDRLLKEGDEFSTGKLRFRILETPGHNTWHITPLEVSQGFAFTGDLLIGNIPAIYDKLDGNLELFQQSLLKLLEERKQMPAMRFLPAHGDEILQPERAIKIVLKTIGILENGLLKKLVEGRKDLVDLMESAFGAHIEGGNHFITALELLEALLRKLMREGRVGSQLYPDGYEEFYLKH
ncbi:MBL fold metallo-hydrolase [Turneriella parva]|uniref:Zn-dependent hydrolase n=1 Tax=Turneriella parva (strain ATCC BAA-1111 / DSM 21527 / NCTC 11395 / H) TaxID=869212 RepID=I4B7I0_TURPD|nr:MBL fold metallo-hydrolase [Turneriella parva]AFM13237.1 Zn-dependent hydrolase [Turneriella parva DSM 21527]